jgi:hypothetical protein
MEYDVMAETPEAEVRIDLEEFERMFPTNPYRILVAADSRERLTMLMYLCENGKVSNKDLSERMGFKDMIYSMHANLLGGAGMICMESEAHEAIRDYTVIRSKTPDGYIDITESGRKFLAYVF